MKRLPLGFSRLGSPQPPEELAKLLVEELETREDEADWEIEECLVGPVSWLVMFSWLSWLMVLLGFV